MIHLNILLFQEQTGGQNTKCYMLERYFIYAFKKQTFTYQKNHCGFGLLMLKYLYTNF